MLAKCTSGSKTPVLPCERRIRRSISWYDRFTARTRRTWARDRFGCISVYIRIHAPTYNRNPPSNASPTDEYLVNYSAHLDNDSIRRGRQESGRDYHGDVAAYVFGRHGRRRARAQRLHPGARKRGLEDQLRRASWTELATLT